jgi:uncharacterized membrane protein YfcA
VPWEWPIGALCAFLLALITTPAGVSGAVLLLPLQLSVLHVPSPTVTPTNLLFNVAAVPGGLLRFRHEQQLLNTLTWVLVAGALPGVVAGAVIRVELLSGGRTFTLIAGGVLLSLGLWLALAGQRLPRLCSGVSLELPGGSLGRPVIVSRTPRPAPRPAACPAGRGRAGPR